MPDLRPDQMDYAIHKVATAMAEGHFGAGIDPAGYMQDARSFVHAFLALDAALEEAEALPDPAAPKETESQPDSTLTGVADGPGIDPAAHQSAVNTALSADLRPAMADAKPEPVA